MWQTSCGRGGHNCVSIQGWPSRYIVSSRCQHQGQSPLPPLSLLLFHRSCVLRSVSPLLFGTWCHFTGMVCPPCSPRRILWVELESLAGYSREMEFELYSCNGCTVYLFALFGSEYPKQTVHRAFVSSFCGFWHSWRLSSHQSCSKDLIFFTCLLALVILVLLIWCTTLFPFSRGLLRAAIHLLTSCLVDSIPALIIQGFSNRLLGVPHTSLATQFPIWT